MGDDMEGFIDDRIIKTRDRHTESQIRRQSSQKRSSEVDLEYDDGRDLPEWDDNVQIEVDNDAQQMKSVIASYVKERPKLEAKRSLNTRKSKQMKEVMVELKEIQEKEKEIERQRRRELQLKKEEEILKKEQEDLERMRRVEADRKRKEELEKQKEEIDTQKVKLEGRV